MGPVQKAMGWTLFFFFIALKHGADTFFAVSSHGADTFFHYLEANEKIFTETNAGAAIFFNEIVDSY